MKRVSIMLANTLVMGAIVVNGQDSTNVTTPPLPVPQDQTTTQDQAQQDQVNFKKGMVIIPPSEVPASLRGTLQGAQYKGWEGGTIYRNQSSDMFILEIRHGNETKMYRFDQNGKAIKDY